MRNTIKKILKEEFDDLGWMRDVTPTILFDNLIFKPHPSVLGGVQATGNFPVNGKWYSVVGGGIGLYGDGVTTFEVWGDGMDDVIGWLTKEEVESWLIEMQS